MKRAIQYRSGTWSKRGLEISHEEYNYTVLNEVTSICWTNHESIPLNSPLQLQGWFLHERDCSSWSLPQIDRLRTLNVSI